MEIYLLSSDEKTTITTTLKHFIYNSSCIRDYEYMYIYQIWIMARRGSGSYSDISLDNLSYKNGLCVEEPTTPLPDPELMWYCGFDGTDEKECIGEKIL